MVKKEIRTERTHLFAPNIGVAIKVEIEGNPTNEQIKEAIKEAVSMNESLNCKIVLDRDGRAYYEKIANPIFSIEISGEEWLTIVKRNTKKAYNIFYGEMCRFFILRHDDVLEFIIIGHHLAGDGLSFTYLLEDIMNALDGNELKYKSLEVIDVNNFPPHSNMQFIKKSYLSILNAKWKARKEVFNSSDYEKIMHEYSIKHSTEIFLDTLNKEETEKVLSESKKIGVSVNSILTTVFIKEYKENAKIGLSIAIRNKSYKGMANLVTGTAILYQYNTNINFKENAIKVHKLIYDNIYDKRKKYFVLRFIDMMDGSFLDSACMVKYLGFNNTVSEKLVKLMNYDKNSKDIGVSNLTRADIRVNYGIYKLKNMAFIPPTVPYANRVFGIVTLEDKMCISMNTIFNNSFKEEKELFERVINVIKNL